MLSNELNFLQEELHYHRVAIEELEAQIAEAKSYEAYAVEATEAVKSAIENIGVGKYLWLFKEHILSLFPQEAPKYLEEKPQEDEIEYMDDSDPNYKSIEVLQQEDPDNIAVFHSKEYLDRQEEKKKKSYYELTGRPDLRPTQYDDLAPNITYSSDGRAYVGFNDYEEAEKFREGLTVPSMLDEAQIMNNHKWELKFYCDREYVEELIEKLPSSEHPNNFEEINPSIIYNHNDSICYVAFSAKGRGDTYGSYLTRILDIAEKYSVSNKPQIVKDSKYELRLEDIKLEDATHLAKFNLKKDWDSAENKEIREIWRTTRKREYPPSYTPDPKPTPIEELKAGDIVHRVGRPQDRYEIRGVKEQDNTLFAECFCLHHDQFSGLVGQTFSFKEVVLIERRIEQAA